MIEKSNDDDLIHKACKLAALLGVFIPGLKI